MDDLNFRRRIYADPNDNSPEVVNACQEDSSKANFKSEMQDFDLQLKQALNVETPDNLSERIILGHNLAEQRAQKRKYRVHLALAASIAFVFGISFQFIGNSPRHTTLGEHALAHLIAEVDHIPNSANYTQAQLNLKLAQFGGNLTESIAPIKFANFCDFDGVRSLHLVLQGDNGDVTIFVVPKDSGFTKTPYFDDLNYHGTTISNQRADMVIITDKNESTDRWTEKVNQSIKWQKA